MGNRLREREMKGGLLDLVRTLTAPLNVLSGDSTGPFHSAAAATLSWLAASQPGANKPLTDVSRNVDA